LDNQSDLEPVHGYDRLMIIKINEEIKAALETNLEDLDYIQTTKFVAQLHNLFIKVSQLIDG
jgi:hypothetical protein